MKVYRVFLRRPKSGLVLKVKMQSLLVRASTIANAETAALKKFPALEVYEVVFLEKLGVM